jgi:predicted porin
MPIGTGQLRAAYARIDPDGANNDSSKVSIGYFYSLSKRTTLYSDLGSAKTAGLTRSSGVDLGVRHTF